MQREKRGLKDSENARRHVVVPGQQNKRRKGL
jgi:hypothetical protein